MPTVIGIDPGAKGGLVRIGTDGTTVAHAFQAPERALSWLKTWAPGADLVVIERVGSMPTDARRAAFSFGRNLGWLEMAIWAAGQQYQTVSPRDWQTWWSLYGMKMSKTEKKRMHRAKAQELYPGIRVTHALADALLIGRYAFERLV